MTDHRRLFQTQVTQIIRCDFRTLFGKESANQCGFFVDRYLSETVHEFADWPIYPKSDRIHRITDGSAMDSAVVSNDGYRLLTGSYSGHITEWDLLTLTEMRQWEAHFRSVKCLAIHPCYLVSGSVDTSVRIWKKEERAYSMLHYCDEHTSDVYCVGINKEGTLVISGSGDQSLLLWSVEDGSLLRSLIGHSARVTSVVFDSFHSDVDRSSSMIISGSWDKSLRQWDTLKESPHSITDHIGGKVYSLCINCDHSLMAVMHGDGYTMFEWPSMKKKTPVMSTHMESTKKAFFGRFHPCNPGILAYCDSHTIWVVGHTSMKPILTLSGHEGSINQLCFTPDGCCIITVAHDKSVRVWDVSHYKLE